MLSYSSKAHFIFLKSISKVILFYLPKRSKLKISLFPSTPTLNLLSVIATVTVFFHTAAELLLCVRPHEGVRPSSNLAVSFRHAVFLNHPSVVGPLGCLQFFFFYLPKEWKENDLWCQCWCLWLFLLDKFLRMRFWIEGSWYTQPHSSPSRLYTISPPNHPHKMTVTLTARPHGPLPQP